MFHSLLFLNKQRLYHSHCNLSSRMFVVQKTKRMNARWSQPLRWQKRKKKPKIFKCGHSMKLIHFCAGWDYFALQHASWWIVCRVVWAVSGSPGSGGSKSPIYFTSRQCYITHSWNTSTHWMDRKPSGFESKKRKKKKKTKKMFLRKK